VLAVAANNPAFGAGGCADHRVSVGKKNRMTATEQHPGQDILIEDATLLTDMTPITLGQGMARSFPELLAEVRAALPDIRIAMDPSITLRTFFRDKQAVHLTCERGEQTLRVRLELDDLALSADQAADFFNIESNVRSLSSAEDLGLAPVVARHIIAAFGGGLRLIKGDGYAGCLEALFARGHNPGSPQSP